MDEESKFRWINEQIRRGEPLAGQRLDVPLFYGETQEGELGLDYCAGGAQGTNQAVMLRLVLSVEAANSLLSALRAWKKRRGELDEGSASPRAH
jgi:hypothetical protein